METNNDQNLLREILVEVRGSRSGIQGLDAIVRKLETEVSGLQANTGRLEAAFNKHIADYERAREERIAFDKRLISLESNFTYFLSRERDRAELEKEDRKERIERQEEMDRERRDARRIFIYFTVGQIIAILLAVYAVIEGRR